MVVRIWQRHALCLYRTGRKRGCAGIFIYLFVVAGLRDALIHN